MNGCQTIVNRVNDRSQLSIKVREAVEGTHPNRELLRSLSFSRFFVTICNIAQYIHYP